MISIRHPALLTAALLILPSAAVSQAAKPASARGVWEPVSYTEDIDLTDVTFVTPDVGWVSGDKGTILHTKDAGKTWEAQLGGDPAAADPDIKRLRFFDERHGWAIKGKKLLATTDGESWEEIAPLPERMGDFVFVSPTDGFAAAGETQYLHEPHNIFRTEDGGRTWKPGPTCGMKATVDGLTKQLGCYLVRFHFPSRSVGYAIAEATCMGSCGPPIMAKTEDGGETWRFFMGPGDVKVASLTDVFFTDEQTGFVTSSEKKVYATADGGNTWKGIVATPGEWLRFADPETGWSLAGGHLAFSTNGGGRWSSRPHRFPAPVRGLSFPRRDRAFVVGDHGMIMRYRVLGAAEKSASGALPAPAMAPFATPIEGQAAELLGLLKSVQPVDTGSSAAGGTGGETVEEETEQGSPAAAGFAIAPPKLKKIDLLLAALGTTVPSFLEQFSNLNLLAARLRSASDLPGRLGDLRSALTAVKKASDVAAANAALAQAFTAAQQLHTAASVATQNQLPAASSAAPGGASSDEPPEQSSDESTEETEE
ncbi:MAG: WD40/YVTN/BNR-like repeat-containing protein [Gemmatimonadales bacterium]